MNEFALDSRLAADTCPLAELRLSRALLMNDARFPWIVLVPRLPGLREITDLSAADAALLMDEIRSACRALSLVARPDKLNVGAIGNKVAQLHIHVVARRESDLAWPEPVWGFGTREPYTDEARAALCAQITAELRT